MSHFYKKPPPFIRNIKDTVVLESSIHGYGLFATKKIEANRLLCVLTGQILKNKKEFENIFQSNLYPKECFIEKHHLGSSEKIMITPFRTSYSFINHSDTIEHLYEKYDNNCVKVYAKIDIEAGNEIVSCYNLQKHIDILGGFYHPVIM